jgi:hypothetical protein
MTQRGNAASGALRLRIGYVPAEPGEYRWSSAAKMRRAIGTADGVGCFLLTNSI